MCKLYVDMDSLLADKSEQYILILNRSHNEI